MRIILFFVCFIGGSGALAQGWYEPQRGSAERSGLMNALRPFAEYVVGPPVQFVVRDLRVSGNVAYASATAQRPGGVPIDPYQTPAFARAEYDPQSGNLDRFHGFFLRSNGGWLLQDHSVDAGEVWWADAQMCAKFGPVIPEYC